MPDATTDAPEDGAVETTDARTGDENARTGDEKDWKAEFDKLQRESRKWEERAKANSTAAKELEELRKQSMSDAEKAVAEAREQARAEAFADVGGRLVKAEVRAVAAGRLGADQLATLLDGLNVAAFLTETGEVDAAKVAQFIDGIAPPPDENTRRTPDLGQGRRSPGATGPGINDLLHAAVRGR